MIFNDIITNFTTLKQQRQQEGHAMDMGRVHAQGLIPNSQINCMYVNSSCVLCICMCVFECNFVKSYSNGERERAEQLLIAGAILDMYVGYTYTINKHI